MQVYNSKRRHEYYGKVHSFVAEACFLNSGQVTLFARLETYADDQCGNFTAFTGHVILNEAWGSVRNIHIHRDFMCVSSTVAGHCKWWCPLVHTILCINLCVFGVVLNVIWRTLRNIFIHNDLSCVSVLPLLQSLGQVTLSACFEACAQKLSVEVVEASHLRRGHLRGAPGEDDIYR